MLRLTTYTSPAHFLERTQAWLEQREANNNLILGVADTLIRTPDRYPQWVLLTVDDEDALRAAALWTPPSNLILHVEDASPEVIDLIARHFCDQDSILPGVTSAVDTATAFADAWTAQAGGSWSVAMRLRAYSLTEVIAPVGVDGTLAQVTQTDRDTVADWATIFTIETLRRPFTREDADRLVSRHIAHGTLFVWCVGGQPASMAAIGRQTRHGATVGLVYTPPEQRGHGYASALVAALSQRILDSGKDFAALFTDLDYPTSNRIYQKIGYRPLGDFDELKFDP